MHICYLDESGQPELNSSTRHFVLLGLAIPAGSWKRKDKQLSRIKQRHGLADKEIHAGWMTRRYFEQERIPGFETLNEAQRRSAVEDQRSRFLTAKAALHGLASIKSDKRNFVRTGAYIHLTPGRVNVFETT